ncbi:DUF4240 domain-containing protein [Streptomyces sp. 351MFTsu5.1]|uniref:DUF4240 domain-containing protein n=1 Tax=Streptomyces sp. 351MFTsu5.1 TaxID=1172180 RepID=UPI0003650CDF
MDFRAGVIASGRDWYERTAQDPDSLAEHPDVVEAANARGDEALFHEDVNYAARDAFERLAGSADAFDEAWATYRPADGQDNEPTDMGEDFDFDDPEEMHRRLPRLARLFLAERD